ncbi:uncharacterized protein BJ171DRAFT_439742 [Polychytrium aggregatum]|uniref:uncharacterized protein n=1 Tax=Polychytrium aggregatum TaxID=110093 RepID=UPI0022FF1189|nr:uncharacterized protein BJ171DRAFT_439742 [Polychytrium aggregatum]KAI9206846.1 hypothetical protein BJ171DRAFT_439742 [Polychytrium aggregatum]
MDIINQMNSRVSFLTNPRFKNQIRRKSFEPATLLQRQSTVRPSQSHGIGIVAIPSSVIFTNYVPFEKYTNILTLKNTTSHSQRLRISTPPPYEYSPYFSIVLIDLPKEYDGLLAPGMCCKYRITFSPDSLANYEQVLMVYTEQGQEFPVHVVAQRDPPVLTIPDILDCGPCRAGYAALKEWHFANIGGAGRFFIMREDEELDPYEIFRRKELFKTDQSVSYGSFEIFPSYFATGSGESGKVLVRYLPQEIDDPTALERLDSVTLKIACDNCQILRLPVTGLAQRPLLEVVSVKTEGGQAVALCEGDLVLDFQEQNPHAVTSWKMTVRNKSNLRLPFYWTVFDYPSATHKLTPKNCSINDAFSIHPNTGYILPSTEMQFTINFSPRYTIQYDTIAELILIEEMERIDPSLPKGARAQTYGDLESALKINCKGIGIQYQMDVYPPIIEVPALLPTSKTWKAQIYMLNFSVSPLSYSWEVEGINPHILKVEMKSTEGKIPPFSIRVNEIQLTGVFPGMVNGFLVCKSDCPAPTHIPLSAKISLLSDAISFGTDMLDFGLMALGTKKTLQVALNNSTSTALSWSVQVHDRLLEKGRPYFIECSPDCGTLDPFQMVMIEVTFIPLWYQKFCAVLVCLIHDQNLTHSAAVTKVHSIVTTPIVTIPNATNSLSCFVGIPFTYTISLRNQTLLKTQFKWKSVNCTVFTAKFTPESGEIDSEATTQIQVEVTCKQMGSFQGLLLPCNIHGMVFNGGWIGATLDAYVCGLGVSLGLQGDTKAPLISNVAKRSVVQKGRASLESKLELKFGFECPIFENRTQTLVIRNRSGIPSPFRIWVETFAATALGDEDEDVDDDEEEDEEEKQGDEVDKTGSKTDSNVLLLKATKAVKIGFNSKAGNAYIANIKEVRKMIKKMHRLLREGRGAAFHPSPSQGILGPFAEVKIQVTSYNNLVGVYRDIMVVEVGGWIRETIPVSLGVVGLPIRFLGAQLVARSKKTDSDIDRVNFGTRAIQMPRETTPDRHVTREPEPIYKTIQIENQSPRDILLKWRIYMKHTGEGSEGSTESGFEIDDVMCNPDYLQKNEEPFGIRPAYLKIPAFKSTSMKISFWSSHVGTFDGFIVADIGYIQPDGAITYSHSSTLNSSKKMKSPSKSNHLAKLHVHGKAIEPKLELDIGGQVRIKRQMTGSGQRTVNAFLKNTTDAICTFTMEAFPENAFNVSCADVNVRPKTGPQGTPPAESHHRHIARPPRSRLSTRTPGDPSPVFELKPTEMMLVAIRHLQSFQTEEDPTAEPIVHHGKICLTFSNGMTQDIPIVVEDPYNKVGSKPNIGPEINATKPQQRKLTQRMQSNKDGMAFLPPLIVRADHP